MSDFDEHLDNYGDPGAGTSNGPEPNPYYTDDTITLYQGNSLEVLTGLPDGSVDCCVTSPPYFGLRDYGVDGQHGAESSPVEYVETMRATFAEVRRVLADDGTLWLNLGDSYSVGRAHSDNGTGKSGLAGTSPTGGRWVGPKLSPDRPPKNLLGIPWRVAFALQDDGWILRNDIIWSKPNAMPESVTDRMSNRHEHLFMFSKSKRYWFDLDPIREPLLHPDAVGSGIKFGGEKAAGYGNATYSGNEYEGNGKGRNPGDVWTIATAPFPGAHFATFPIELPRRCIQAGCKPGGVVLDPYSGSGTTGLAACQLGRKYVGIDLNAEYLDLSLRTRLVQGTLGLD